MSKKNAKLDATRAEAELGSLLTHCSDGFWTRLGTFHASNGLADFPCLQVLRFQRQGYKVLFHNVSICHHLIPHSLWKILSWNEPRENYKNRHSFAAWMLHAGLETPGKSTRDAFWSRKRHKKGCIVGLGRVVSGLNPCCQFCGPLDFFSG